MSASSGVRKFFLLRYAYPADVLIRRAPHRAAHLALANAEKEAGRLLLGGALEPASKGGVLAWHATREEVDAFVARDPYVTQGVVTSFELDEWNVAIKSAHL